MAQGPPSSDSESDDDVPECAGEYQYESEGEEMLGNSARALLREARGNYRLARAAILAYTRPDLNYISSTPPSRTRGTSRMSSSSRVAASSGMSPPRVVHPTPQPLPRTQSLPPTSNALRTRFLTPPSTPAVPRRSPTSGAVTNHETPEPQHLHEGRGPSEHHPTPISGPQRQFYTLVYPLLGRERMSHYFRQEDGVSKRPPDDVCEILRQIRSNDLWLGDIRYVDVTAVGGAVADQVVHQPASTATSEIWYLIIVGAEVGVFTSWSDVAPHILGVSCAIQHSSRTKREAYRSFQYALVLGTVRLVPRPLVS